MDEFPWCTSSCFFFSHHFHLLSVYSPLSIHPHCRWLPLPATSTKTGSPIWTSALLTKIWLSSYYIYSSYYDGLLSKTSFNIRILTQYLTLRLWHLKHHAQFSLWTLPLEQGCQTQIHSGPKFKTGTKSRANINIYWKKNLPPDIRMNLFLWTQTSFAEKLNMEQAKLNTKQYIY